MPERRRETTWRSFLSTHWDVLASIDFTTIDVWTRTGLVTHYLLFFMELSTRGAHLAPLTANPDEAGMLRVARNVTDAEASYLRGKKCLLMGRDGKISEAFRGALEQAGVEAVGLPLRSPSLSPHIERFMCSLKEECLGRIIFIGERALQSAAGSFVERSHADRSHQGVGNRRVKPGEDAGRTTGEVVSCERLGGLLRYYYRQAA